MGSERLSLKQAPERSYAKECPHTFNSDENLLGGECERLDCMEPSLLQLFDILSTDAGHLVQNAPKRENRIDKIRLMNLSENATIAEKSFYLEPADGQGNDGLLLLLLHVVVLGSNNHRHVAGCIDLTALSLYLS